MFNQIGFNSLPFNREYNVDVQLSFVMSHSNELFFLGNIQVQPKFEIDHILESEFAAARDKLASFAMELVQEMDFMAVRHRTGQFDMQLKLESDFNMARFQALTLTFTGPFAPGDKIVIDSERLKITKNGANALSNMSGDFINLFVGDNRLVWTDDKTQRNVLIRLAYRDRYL